MISLPGLIDPHVHLREPGAAHKEDFDTGTAAALVGGFTLVLAMPNTAPPLIDSPSLTLARKAAKAKARCDFGLFLGAGPDNTATSTDVAAGVCGMKMYLDQTYGPLRLEGLAVLLQHFHSWPRARPIAAHAEGRNLAAVILLAALHDRPVHICHVSRKEEILLIRAAKEKGIKISCEVTPHHMFLTQEDLPHLGPGRGEVRPRLASRDDQHALWENLAVIDCFATDHAPHTTAEKDGPEPPPGFPGLETALGLWLGAVEDGRLTLDDLIQRMYTNPRRIFHLTQQLETDVIVDEHATWLVRAEDLRSRCGWSPFEGMLLRGVVRHVRLRGRTAFEDGEVLAPCGSGRDLFYVQPIHTS
ncbi:MAG TPA: amidohydrolase family protein [Anaerolineales bacterium]|nr:amidohydrolase family protein [Anaerolineales bacterium]